MKKKSCLKITISSACTIFAIFRHALFLETSMLASHYLLFILRHCSDDYWERGGHLQEGAYMSECTYAQLTAQMAIGWYG